MDLGQLMKARQAWKSFTASHPRFPDFLRAVRKKGLEEGTMIEIAVRYPDGEVINSGLKVKPADLELLKLLESLDK